MEDAQNSDQGIAAAEPIESQGEGAEQPVIVQEGSSNQEAANPADGALAAGEPEPASPPATNTPETEGAAPPVGTATPKHAFLSIERVRALPELAEGVIAEIADGPITFFKSIEGHTMRVVHYAGEFFKMRM